MSVDEPTVALPLASVRVIDLTRQLAGPHCGQILGDLGAEVIKVENPDSLDESRYWPPIKGGVGCYFLAGNRNKRSVTLDLSTDSGLESLHRLIDSADIVLENFRPDVGERFGLDAPTFRSRYPRVVLGSIRGFYEGPLAGTAAYDASIQAISGMMSLTGPKGGDPARIGVAVVDQSAALYATIGILGALRRAEREGQGSHVEVALFDSAISTVSFQVLSWTQGGVLLGRTGTAHPAMTPNKVFVTAGGEILVMAGNDRQWAQLCEVLGVPELKDDARFATNVERVRNQDALYEIVDPLFLTRTRDEWQVALRAARVACAPVNRMDEVGEYLERHSTLPAMYRHVDGREFGVISNPIRLDGSLLPVRELPIDPGRDNDEILGRDEPSGSTTPPERKDANP